MKPSQHSIDRNVLAAMGDTYRDAHLREIREFQARIVADPTDFDSFVGLADVNVILFVFAYISRNTTLPAAKSALDRAQALDPASPEVSRLTGVLRFLDWDWTGAEAAFQDAIRDDPNSLGARHWYSLLLVALGRFDEAMAQSDEIMKRDTNEDYLVGRGSLFWFQHRFEELKQLMHRCISKDPQVPWGHDWLGMAYNALAEHADAIRTYERAFALSGGTAEVGAGYAHALGEAGDMASAREMANFYAAVAEERYVPPVQRAYIHIGLGEHDEAIRLLEEAFEQRSWFLAFMKVEPWLDPLRDDPRFGDILNRMGYP